MLVRIGCIGEGRVLEGVESLREDEELWGGWGALGKMILVEDREPWGTWGALGKMKIPVEDREHWGG